MDFGYAGPCSLGQQRLAAADLQDDLNNSAQAGEPCQRVVQIAPELNQADGQQAVQYSGKTAVILECWIKPPEPDIDTKGTDDQCPQQMPLQSFLKQSREKPQRTDVPKRMFKITVHPMPGNQSPDFALSDCRPVVHPSLGRRSQDQIAGQGQSGEKESSPWQRQAAMAPSRLEERDH